MKIILNGQLMTTEVILHTQGLMKQKGRKLIIGHDRIALVSTILTGSSQTESGYMQDTEKINANARRLVHCWNCHDELLEALEACLLALTDEMGNVKRREYDASLLARAVLAKAKGKT